MPNKNFVILIGGPGQFIDCDPKHDKTWLNYIEPIRRAADSDLYGKEANETVHWFVFEPPYMNRWTDDSEITMYEHVEKFFQDAELHELRKTAADTVVSKGATSYLNRIKQLAAAKGVTYHGLKTTDDFWIELAKFPDGSVSRVWYSGHAADVGLMLSLAHDNECAAVSTTVVRTSDIPAKKSMIEAKIDSSTSNVSKFYGCGTSVLYHIKCTYQQEEKRSAARHASAGLAVANSNERTNSRRFRRRSRWPLIVLPFGSPAKRPMLRCSP